MKRTREQFIDLHKHQFAGLLMDAVTTRRAGEPLAKFLEQAWAAIEKRLGQAWDDLQEVKPGANGAVPQQEKAKK